MTTVFEFPRGSKPAVSLSATLPPRQSKAELLKVAHALSRQDDPIFALIHAHRRAWQQWSDAVDAEFFPFGDPAAGQKETDRRADIKLDLLADLGSATPLTIEGVAALAAYYGEVHETEDSELTEENYLEALANIARVLRRMAAQS